MTLYLAIWGALVGTASLIWNVWKWRQESPRIVEKIQAVNSRWDENAFAGIRLVLRNRGGKKTTIEEIYLNRHPKWKDWGWRWIFMRLFKKVDWQHNPRVSNPKTVKLPVLLDVNSVWEGFIPLELYDPDNEEELTQLDRNRDILDELKSGTLRYSIQCSHRGRRIRGRVEFEDIFDSE